MTPGASGGVLAHGIAGRQDLPIPYSFALWGAAATLVVSFVLLGVLWRSPRLRGEAAGRPLPPGPASVLDSAAVRWALRILGLALTAYIGAAVLLGPDLATNPAPRAVYVLFWVGLVPLSVLFGPVWRRLNPLRTLHLLLSSALRVAPHEGLLPLPRRLGYWPAAVGLFAFVWLELVFPDPAALSVIRTWFALYAGGHLIASALYGQRWFDRGDAFEVWSDAFGRLSVLGRRRDGRLVVRNPLDGMASRGPAPGLVAVVSVLLGSTAYDGLSSDPGWVSRLQTSGSPTLLGTVGLLGVVLAVAAVYVTATLVASWLSAGRTTGTADGRRRHGAPGEFAHTLVPIALGYLVAHYYSLLVLEGQRALIQLSDPLGTGADVLGIGDRRVSSAPAAPTLVATIQVGAVVAGHVLGVVLAHDRAVRLFPPGRRTFAAQLPLLAAMVAFTLFGLGLLFTA
ncbi:MAG: hypothetical protein M3P48_11175 [Actinomycetota bacterium]|nr:hypothetical protein [Actinomycetota bacterium]